MSKSRRWYAMPALVLLLALLGLLATPALAAEVLRSDEPSWQSNPPILAAPGVTLAAKMHSAQELGKKIGGGFQHAIALKSDGTAVVWGRNNFGQCNVPSGLSDIVAVAACGNHSLALKSNGTVTAWGWNGFGQCNVPAGLSGVVSVSGRNHHSLALKSNGTVTAWGWNSFGQCNVPAGLSGVVAVAAGEGHSLALKSDGTVAVWGDNSYGQCKVPSGLDGVVAVSGGFYHSLALKSDGTVVAWGWNGYGQCSIPAGLSGVVAVSGGIYHSLALKSDGTVVAWGYNGQGQCNIPAGLSSVVAVSAGGHFNLALKSDGTVVAWGHNGYGQCNVPAGLNLIGDSASPTTAISLEGPQGNNGWYTGNVLVTLAASDNAGGSGLKLTEFNLNGGAWSTYTGPFTLANEGTTSVQYRSADNAGNVEATKVQQVRIDKSQPAVVFGPADPSANGYGWHKAAVSFTFTASDVHSGVAATVPAASPLVVDGEGSGLTGYVAVTDNAGHSANFTSPAVNIDKTAPVINIASPTSGPYYTSGSITLDFSGTDSLSGMENVTSTLDGSPVSSGQTFSLAALAGSHTLTVTATDKAGNKTAKTVTFTTIIAATVDINPDTLNLKSISDKNSVTAYIELSPGYNVAAIDAATVKMTVNGTVLNAQPAPTALGDHDGDGVHELMVKFDRQQVLSAVAVPGDITFKVTGSLKDGRLFEGCDKVRAIDSGGGKK